MSHLRHYNALVSLFSHNKQTNVLLLQTYRFQCTEYEAACISKPLVPRITRRVRIEIGLARGAAHVVVARGKGTSLYRNRRLLRKARYKFVLALVALAAL